MVYNAHPSAVMQMKLVEKQLLVIRLVALSDEFDDEMVWRISFKNIEITC
ncbi:hypothetical protein ABBL099_00040 [Acinetobacter baumannii]|nr:hypothetical protein ABBL099_02404 [Acinetobacter baumannii]KFG14555.1 hypothetical protein ABBL099_00040 [Acinetobacter baumannii]